VSCHSCRRQGLAAEEVEHRRLRPGPIGPRLLAQLVLDLEQAIERRALEPPGCDRLAGEPIAEQLELAE
jgi:hypothetical protein